ncbi:F-box/kelch-repeat protein At1g57790-like [Vicia villosa]|uniref:F-box/kelch-repeat protein At1g57790-like n=1 Tax=Vicia villosa TaxID=3911 RepID=UPI00273ABCBC|nr:F-box/kelch-repeat protein At1g57790-like [Vicia villosa]
MMKAKMKKKLKSHKLTDNGKATAIVKSGIFEQRTWADFPVELLELIFSGLIVADNIRASIVCKRWHSVATSVRQVNQSPWLMYLPKHGNSYDLYGRMHRKNYGFYDPRHQKTYSLEFPQLDRSRVFYTKDGWLLVYQRNTRPRPESFLFFFFNPFTRELIKLPKEYDHRNSVAVAAFSCAPTSTECVIFTIKNVGSSRVAISTCYPGAIEWTTDTYRNCSHFSCGSGTKIVFSNGLFYCLSYQGFLGVFDPIGCTWTVLEVPPPRSQDSFIDRKGRKGQFMTEHEGNIFVIHMLYMLYPEGPIIYKLDRTLMEWKDVRTLGGVTVFASFLSSPSRTCITEKMRNSVYFPKFRVYGKCCMSFSLDEQRYYPNKQLHDWIQPGIIENIWIEPPKDFAGWN